MKSSITRSTVQTGLVLGLRLITQAGTLLLVARLLGAQQFGAFAGVAALALLLGTLSTFGTHLVLLGEVSKSPPRRERVLSYAIPGTLGVGGLLLVVFCAASVALFGDLRIAPVALVLIGVTELLLQPLLTLMVAEHHGRGRVAGSQLLQMAPLLLRFSWAAVILVASVSNALVVYAAGYMFASVIALALGAHTLPSTWPGPGTWRWPRTDERATALGYAVSNISRAGPAELDKALALQLLSHGGAGVYAAASRVIGGIFLPVTAMTLAALPRLFRDAGGVAGQRLLTLMCAVALAYGLCLVVLMWLVAPLFEWLFGSGYSGITELIRWLCLAIPALAVRVVAGNALIASGRPWLRVTFEFAGIAVLIVSAGVLTSQFGSTGMALALVFAEWVMAMLGLFFVLALRSNAVR